MITFLIIGSFKKGFESFDGQTTKVRNYSAEIKKVYKDCKILELDTFRFSSILYIFCHLIDILFCDVVLILPCANGIRLILPIVVFLKKINNCLLLYPVVGGWLPIFSQQHRFYKKLLKNVDKIYVETKKMKSLLESQGLVNIEWAPAFSRRTPLNNYPSNDFTLYSICYFSRVTQSKGIGLAINAVNMANKKLSYKKYTLNIYGPLDPNYKSELEKQIAQAEFKAISYHGILDNNDAISTLSRHWCMVFPTSYQGEGFPIAVLEGMMAGLPILASDWRYNSEIVLNGVNGYLFDLKDGAEGLEHIIEKLASDELSYHTMCSNTLELSKTFSPQNVLNPMFQLINQKTKKQP